MFSGGDSSDDINNLNQLSSYGFVNQVAVSNAMAAGQNIDWAQLAQQWIQMRDNSAMATTSDANAIGKKIVDHIPCSNLKFEEKGEADMDMDDEEQNDDKGTQRLNNNFASTSVTHNNMNQPWFFSEGSSQIAQRPASNSEQWNPWQSRGVLPQSTSNQHNSCIITNRPTNPTAHIPSLLKINVPHPNEIRSMPDISNQSDGTTIMDAAKRKGLPAWIREGLEKMEREKQKQLEKEQQNKDANSSDEDNVSNKNIFPKSLNSLNGVPDEILEDGSTDNEDIVVTTRANTMLDVNKDDEEEEEESYSPSVGKTYEQKLADLMIIVRQTLTELLLETTNEEIYNVADETIKTFKSKASSAQVIRKSALSTLTSKLGLAVYGGSSSEDNSDDEHNSSKKATGQSESENDSEEEIRNIMRLKRRTFIKISEEIEERVASAAVHEEEKLKYFLRKEEEQREHNRNKQERSSKDLSSSSGNSGKTYFKGYEKDFGEITETKIQHLNGKRQRDRSSRRERTTRFSDNKDKYVAVPNAATFLTNMNATANSGSGNSTACLSNNTRQNIPDLNGLLPNYTNAGMTTVLNAADAALEKVLKGNASASSEKHSRHERDRSYVSSRKRQRRSSESKESRSRSKSSSSSTSSSSSSKSSDSDTSSTSRSSHHSKSNQRSVKKQKSAHRKYEKSHKDYRGDRKYSSSSSSYRKRDRESKRSRYHRNVSSDSEDEYRRRHKYDTHYSRNSSHSRCYTSSSKRDRDREHSRSQSRSSYSSSNNRRH